MSIELIKARQSELKKQQDEREQKRRELETRAAELFASTGIPEMWEKLKHIEVPHWRGGRPVSGGPTSADIPLAEHAKFAGPTGLGFFSAGGCVRIAWTVYITDKDSVFLGIYGDDMNPPRMHITPGEMREHFISYMAKLIPPL